MASRRCSHPRGGTEGAPSPRGEGERVYGGLYGYIVSLAQFLLLSLGILSNLLLSLTIAWCVFIEWAGFLIWALRERQNLLRITKALSAGHAIVSEQNNRIATAPPMDVNGVQAALATPLDAIHQQLAGFGQHLAALGGLHQHWWTFGRKCLQK